MAVPDALRVPYGCGDPHGYIKEIPGVEPMFTYATMSGEIRWLVFRYQGHPYLIADWVSSQPQEVES